MANTRVTNPVTGFNSATEEGLKLPSGTNANLPTGVQGMIRNDTDETTGSSASAIEHYNGTAWQYFAATESPDPVVPSQNFNTVLYTGTGVSNPITGVGFQPDLVWIKARNIGYNHRLFDSVRTLNGRIESNTTAAEVSTTQNDNFASFDSNGFTLGATSSTNGSNFSGEPFVAWCWKAGGAAVSNTDGDITSQVSANVAGGFSIASYTGNGTAGATVGHGLDSTPEMVIVKRLSGIENWAVYTAYSHPTAPENYLLTLDENYAASLNSTRWNNTAPTSVTFSVGTSQAVNANSNNYIAYCFHSVPGYSKVGSYTGTGAGTTITTGFQPAFVMIKKTSGSADWIIFNDKTGSNILKPNTTATEVVLTNYITYNSTGFTLPTNDSNINSGDFIYMAFATS